MTKPRLRRIALLALVIPLGCLIVLALGLLIWYLLGEASFRDETYLIPSGFEGPVLILYNRPEGQPARYEGNSLIYDVPSTGVMQVQWGTQNVRTHYWYVNSDGTRTPIRPSSQTMCRDDAPGDPIVVCDMPIVLGATQRHSGFVVTHISKVDRYITAFFKIESREINSSTTPVPSRTPPRRGTASKGTGTTPTAT